MDLDGYVDVAKRLETFYARFPDGSVQMDPPTFTEVLGQQFVWAQARAYRHPDDPRPGIGTAWEQIPGKTPFTRGSELMCLETSAWGRCIRAVMHVDGPVASAEEVTFAQARRSDPVAETSHAMGTYHTPSGKTISRGDQPITEPQLKKLRYEIRRLCIDEVMLNDFTTDALGFEIPPAGLEYLTKAQASTLIDALTKTVDKLERTRTPDPDDPWSK